MSTRVSGPEHNRLSLVALVHGDPDGYKKLSDLFQQLRPDYITVEASSYGIEFRKQHSTRLLNELGRRTARLVIKKGQSPGGDQHSESISRALGLGAIESIVRQFRMPYEVRAARDYGKTRSVQWEPIDLDRHSEIHTATWESLVSEDNLRVLLKMEQPAHAHTVASEKRRALSALKAETSVGAIPDDLQERDKAMADYLESILVTRSYKSIVHIGGWRHMIPGEPQNLLARLTSHDPTLYFLGP